MGNWIGMWGEAAGVLSAISAAIGSLQVRALGQNINPFLMNAIRCFLASIFFILVWQLGSGAVGDWYSALPLLLLTVTSGLVVGDSLYFSAIVRIGSARATPIAMSYPLPTAFLAYLILDEHLSYQKLAGIMIGVIAIWMVATKSGGFARDRTINRDYVIGVGLACTASICWSVSVLTLRPALSMVPIEFANFVRMFFAFLILGFISLRVGNVVHQIQGLSRSLALIAGLGVTAVATSALIAESIHHSGASVAALMSSMTPIFAAPMAWFFFNETINFRLIVGIGLGIVGILMVAFSS